MSLDGEFTTPRLLIADYYDKLINQIDIYTEKLAEKYSDEAATLPKAPEPIRNLNALLNVDDDDDDESEGMFYNDPYSSQYKYKNESAILQIEPGVTRVRDYLGLVRAKAINDIKKVQENNLDAYELNKETYDIDIDREDIDADAMRDLKSRLFADKFCFLLMIESFNGMPNQCIFKLYTVITDFYLDHDNLFLLRRYFTRSMFGLNVLNKETLFLHLLKEYIGGIWRSQKYGIEVVHVTKKSILAIEKVICDYMYMDEVDLNSQSSIFNFSSIKSLVLGKDELMDDDGFDGHDDNESHFLCKNNLINLSALSSLESLKIYHMKLRESALDNLKQLVKLELIECDLSRFDLKCLSQFTNLAVLKIENLVYPLDCVDLIQLKWLSLPNIKDLKSLRNLGQGLETLEMNFAEITSENAEIFFRNLELPNLSTLKLASNKLSTLRKEWFHGCSNLKHLNLSKNSIIDMFFLQCECLSKLELLDLSNNNIRALREDEFGKQRNLRSLILDCNPIERLQSHVFRGLARLERLSLHDLKSVYEVDFFEKDTFAGLDSLTTLNLSSNLLDYIDPDLFVPMPKLAVLDLHECKLKLKNDTFSHLRNLKWINLKDAIPNLSEELLTSLRNSNIEILF